MMHIVLKSRVLKNVVKVPSMRSLFLSSVVVPKEMELFQAKQELDFVQFKIGLSKREIRLDFESFLAQQKFDLIVKNLQMSVSPSIIIPLNSNMSAVTVDPEVSTVDQIVAIDESPKTELNEEVIQRFFQDVKDIETRDKTHDINSYLLQYDAILNHFQKQGLSEGNEQVLGLINAHLALTVECLNLAVWGVPNCDIYSQFLDTDSKFREVVKPSRFESLLTDNNDVSQIAVRFCRSAYVYSCGTRNSNVAIVNKLVPAILTYFPATRCFQEMYLVGIFKRFLSLYSTCDTADVMKKYVVANSK